MTKSADLRISESAMNVSWPKTFVEISMVEFDAIITTFNFTKDGFGNADLFYVRGTRRLVAVNSLDGHFYIDASYFRPITTDQTK